VRIFPKFETGGNHMYF